MGYFAVEYDFKSEEEQKAWREANKILTKSTSVPKLWIKGELQGGLFDSMDLSEVKMNGKAKGKGWFDFLDLTNLKFQDEVRDALTAADSSDNNSSGSDNNSNSSDNNSSDN